MSLVLWSDFNMWGGAVLLLKEYSAQPAGPVHAC